MKSRLLVLALGTAMASAIGIGSAMSAPPVPTADVRIIAADCASVGATLSWDRARIERVAFTYVFGSSGPYVQTQTLAKATRSGQLADRLTETTTMPFTDGAGSVRAELYDPRGQLVASDDVSFSLNGC